MNISLIRLSHLHDWSQCTSMFDANVCQIYNGNFIKIQTLRVKDLATIRHLTNVYSFIKCDMFLCNVQDLKKQLHI